MPLHSETCLNRTSLAPNFAFGLDRCSVYRVLIDKDFLPWDFIYGSINTGFPVYSGFGLDKFSLYHKSRVKS